MYKPLQYNKIKERTRHKQYLKKILDKHLFIKYSMYVIVYANEKLANGVKDGSK